MPFSVEGHGETRESLARKVGTQVRELAAPVQVVEIEGGADGSGHPVFERRLVHDGFVERRHGQELHILAHAEIDGLRPRENGAETGYQSGGREAGENETELLGRAQGAPVTGKGDKDLFRPAGRHARILSGSLSRSGGAHPAPGAARGVS